MTLLLAFLLAFSQAPPVDDTFEGTCRYSVPSHLVFAPAASSQAVQLKVFPPSKGHSCALPEFSIAVVVGDAWLSASVVVDGVTTVTVKRSPNKGTRSGLININTTLIPVWQLGGQ